MGRLPCCDKVGVKKGPWTPEEDIMLVSYVQEHGPGNWRAVPTNTGLKRCSKSCRLRWTNYLRPGIKRGTFTDHEEKMIIQLQALLGNKWAAIASYLPERTDNDIKNYWNTHLKKKLKKLEIGAGDQTSQDEYSSKYSHPLSKGEWERRLRADINTAKQALQDALSVEETNNLSEFFMPSNHGSFSYTKPVQTSSYASSTENIARLLKGWAKNTPKSEDSKCSSNDQNSSNNYSDCCSGEIVADQGKSGVVDLSQAFDSLFGFDQSFESSNADDFSRSASPSLVHGEAKPGPTGLGPLSVDSVLENWLIDDQAGKEYLENLSFDENPDLF